MQALFNESELKAIKNNIVELKDLLVTIERAMSNSSDRTLKSNIKPLIKSMETKFDNIDKILK